MDGKQVAIPRDDKEVLADYSGKQVIDTSEEKQVAISDDKELTHPHPIKTLDVVRSTDNEYELRDPSNGTTSFKTSREIEKNLFSSNTLHISILKFTKTSLFATGKVNVKTGGCEISSGKDGGFQTIRRDGNSYGFSAGDVQLTWEPASVGVDLGRLRLVDAAGEKTLAVWKTDTSVAGQAAKIEYFEAIVETQTEALVLAAIFSIQESMKIAAERDDDHGGGSRKFAGVDPGNSMGMGGVGGGGGMM